MDSIRTSNKICECAGRKFPKTIRPDFRITTHMYFRPTCWINFPTYPINKHFYRPHPRGGGGYQPWIGGGVPTFDGVGVPTLDGGYLPWTWCTYFGPGGNYPGWGVPILDMGGIYLGREMQNQNLLRGGQYASCVHARGLSFLKNIFVQSSQQNFVPFTKPQMKRHF